MKRINVKFFLPLSVHPYMDMYIEKLNQTSIVKEVNDLLGEKVIGYEKSDKNDNTSFIDLKFNVNEDTKFLDIFKLIDETIKHCVKQFPKTSKENYTYQISETEVEVVPVPEK